MASEPVPPNTLATRPVLRVLLIEDNPNDIRDLQQALAAERDTILQFEYADQLATGLERLASGGIDVVLFDVCLPDNHDLDGIDRLASRAPGVPIVVLTASDNEGMAVSALRRGAQDYLIKGYVRGQPSLLGRSIRYAIERKQLEEQLLRAHTQTDRLLASLPSILIGVDTRGTVTHWNAIAEATLGPTAAEVLHRSLPECPVHWDHAKVLEGLETARREDRPIRIDDIRFTHPDGRQGQLGITVIPVRGAGDERPGFLLFGADVTERREAEAERMRLQQELMQAQKLETIGQFAGGIAHDFQNVLQMILGFACLLRSRYKDAPDLRDDVEEIIHAAENAAGMVRQLLVFSRRQTLRPTVLELNQTIRNNERILQQFVGERIRVALNLAAEPLLVKLDSTGLEQILMNLCSNARDSMAQGGQLSIRTALAHLDAAFRQTRPWAREGDFIRLSVGDTGTGMDPEVAAHIFEPFFTTKQQGKGTGLGLAVVYGLVKQHDGLIDVETAPGRGTTFHLYFPHQRNLKAAPIAALPVDTAVRQSRRRALVIELGQGQPGLVETILRDAGYEVSATVDETQALTLLRQGVQVDVVIVEASMGDSAAPPLLDRLRACQSGIKVVWICGFIDERLRMLERTLGGIRIVQKPYVPAQLIEALRDLTGRAGTRVAGKHRVLVVDDEAGIRQLCTRILKDEYEVTAAASGEAAVAELSRNAYDLLVTDIQMPGLDGFGVIQRSRQLRPELKVVVMSAFISPEVEERLRTLRPSCAILRKPFVAEALQDEIRRLH